jgi:hypothetical protein
MSRKTFKDWDGARRKEIVRPTNPHGHKRVHRMQKRPALQTLRNIEKAEIARLLYAYKTMGKWRSKWRFEFARNTIKKIRAVREQIRERLDEQKKP